MMIVIRASAGTIIVPAPFASFHLSATYRSPHQSLMSAFDLLEERTTLREIANEWITDGGSSNAAGHSPALDLNATFEDGLRRVTLCYEELKASVARGDRNVYATAAHALGEAVRQVAALEVRLSDLLALRGDEALLVLDALQTVSL
jgi:hypothetical protein